MSEIHIYLPRKHSPKHLEVWGHAMMSLQTSLAHQLLVSILGSFSSWTSVHHPLPPSWDNEEMLRTNTGRKEKERDRTVPELSPLWLAGRGLGFASCWEIT